MHNHPMDPRFEFRTFGQSFGHAADLLRTLSQTATESSAVKREVAKHEVAAQEEENIYILSATNQRYNIKIRGGKLDVKVLLREYVGLERWYPYYQFDFPLTSAFLHEFLFAWLEIDPPLLRRCHYTAPQFVQELLRPNPHLRTVEVCKKRRHYTVNDCQIELAWICVDDRYQVQTIAVEGADAEAVLQTVDMLGLQVADNTNYIVGLHQILGKEALPQWLLPTRPESGIPALAQQIVFTC